MEKLKKMIEKLTKYQESQLEVYKNKWLKIGLSTERIDRKKAIKICNNLYDKILLKKIAPVIFFDNPIQAWFATYFISENPNIINEYNTKELTNLIKEKQEHTNRKDVPKFVHPYIDGSFSASYFSFYDYMNKILEIKFDNQESFDIYMQTVSIGLVYPLDEICIVSEKPIEINMKDGKLHADGKPSIKYKGNFNVWSLNGVRVTKEIAETPSEKLNPRLILTEKNAEIRREIVRKIGIERVIKKLGAKVIDSEEDYDLLNFNVLGEERIYLKMKNPSIGTYHIEGVHPSCKTVEDALSWRNGTNEKPRKLT